MPPPEARELKSISRSFLGYSRPFSQLGINEHSKLLPFAAERHSVPLCSLLTHPLFCDTAVCGCVWSYRTFRYPHRPAS